MCAYNNSSIKFHKKAVRLSLHFLVNVFSTVFNIYSQTPRQRRILTRNYNRKSNFHHIFIIVALSFAFLLLAIDTNAQSSYTPAALKHGPSAGSTALSEFESINPYSGNLNFSLPLIGVGGRGSTSLPLKLNINQRWMFKQWYDELDQNREYPYMKPNTWNVNYRGKDTIDSPVRVNGIRTGSGVNNYCPGQPSPPIFNYTNTILTFIAPDGTEYQMRDRNTNGQPYQVNCWQNPFSRGTIFDTIDGSTATFISDNTIYDDPIASHHEQEYWLYPTGNLITKDGTLFRIEGGGLKWSRDKNGNKITMTYLNQGANFKLTDSLNREVVVEYDVQDISPYGLCNRITYKGFGGADRIIRISYDDMLSHLRAGYSPQTGQQLFPVNFASSYPQYNGDFGASTNYTTSKVSAVWLPDGRSYKLQYNSYGELARVELPTGGAIEYDWGFNSGSGQLGMICGSNASVTGSTESYYRRVTKRRVYSNGTTLDNELILSGLEPLGNKTGYVVEDQYDSSNNLVNRIKHYYYGIVGSNDSLPSYGLPPMFQDPWRNGREYQTDVFDSNGTTLLRKTTSNWQQSSPSWWTQSSDYAPTTNPHITETTTTLADSNQVSKRAFTYDSFNNLTDTYEYDYGTGAPGQFLRRSHADYLTTNPVNNINYTSDTIHILNLPTQTWVSSDTSGNSKVSRSQYEYDNYANDTNHSALVDRSGISGHNSNYGTSFTYRGNATKVTSYADAQNQGGAVSVYSQYDIAGNHVKAIDARGYSNTINYADSFGAPDGEARINTAPSPLNGQQTFAFATSVTNPAGYTSYAQFDYYTGSVVDTEDLNGNISTTYSVNDPLDRPTQSVSFINRPSLKRQTTTVYDDTNRKVTITSDSKSYGDNLIKGESYYDKMGRTTETRAYENGSNYIATLQQYDALGRAYKSSNPYRPFLGEQPQYTTASFDALGRVYQVQTPDNATITRGYLGSTTTLTDQAQRKRSGTTDAIGRLTNVVEDPTGVNYQTTYLYDVLGRLRKTTQIDGQTTQNRYFMYNDLGRLIRVKQPEQIANVNLATTDPVTGNGNWSVSYSYDNNGNVTSTTDANNKNITGVYDNLNRLTNRNYFDGTPSVTFTFDNQNIDNSKGQLTAVTSTASETYFNLFDELGRVKSSSQVTGDQTYSFPDYTYDLSGALVSETYPSQRVVTTETDGIGRLSRVVSQFPNQIQRTYLSNLSYTAFGAVSGAKLGNGRWESAQFDTKRLQLQQIGLGASAGDTSLLKLEYGYGTTDNNGSLRQQKITVPGMSNQIVQNYTYDSLNRLQSATETPNGSQTTNWKQTFSYDRFGNRRFDANNTTTLPANNATYNPNFDTAKNRFLVSEGYNYDNEGNLTGNPESQLFSYDAENRQIQVTNNAAQTTANYSYDGNGRRVRKDVGNQRTIFVYDAFGKLIAEYTTNQTITSNGTQYLTADALGSPRAATNIMGQVASRHDYMPFGEELASGIGGRTTAQGYGQSDNARQKFTGYERDGESGLDYAQARYYSGKHGRFTSVDPLTASANIKNPQTLNRYTYGLNSPYRFTDPLGLSACEPGAGSEITYNSGCQADCPPTCPNFTAPHNPNADGLGVIVTVDVVDIAAAAAPIIDTIVAHPSTQIIGRALEALPVLSTNVVAVPGIILMTPMTVGTTQECMMNGRNFCHDIEHQPKTESPGEPFAVPPATDDPNNITLFRGLNAKNPGAFRVDADGVSVFEFPSPTHKMNLAIQAVYHGPKLEGTRAALTHPALSQGHAVYTPSLGGPGHWSLVFPNLSEQQIKQTLSDFAKSVLK